MTATTLGMRVFALVLLMILSAVAASAGEIREFDVKTIERLGRELSRRDTIAARAADAVLATQPLARSLKMRGWITELGKSEDKVYLIADTPSGPRLAYTVAFRDSAKPEVADRRGQEIPPKIAIRLAARNTAAAALKGKLYNIPYNFEVVDDPDGSGFLVYALGASTTADVILAGHFRVTVSSDGTKAERIDALSKSVAHSGEIKADTAALFLVQLVSNKPVETLICTSNMTKKPIYVRTPDGKTWVLGEGKMRIVASKVSK